MIGMVGLIDTVARHMTILSLQSRIDSSRRRVMIIVRSVRCECLEPPHGFAALIGQDRIARSIDPR
jgi:hypothetical protein